MRIPLLDLKVQYNSIKGEINDAINEVLESQHFILGPKVKKLEEEIAEYSQCKYALGVSSGTDAILLALMGLDIGQGDIVITTPYTFFATAGCIVRAGAKPVFVDIDPNTYNIDPKKLNELLETFNKEELIKVKAVIPVHLFGQMADMQEINQICKKYNIRIIEDAAQAIGAECIFESSVKKAGSIGDIGCFSFFPSKNLGGYGDGGMVVTNDEELYDRMKLLRSHGASPKYYHKLIGGNFRLDEMQAAILLVKLKYLNSWTLKRQKNAAKYNGYLKVIKNEFFKLPAVYSNNDTLSYKHIYNQFCIYTNRRDNLKSYLEKNEIATEIYYPSPMHMQECFKFLNYKEGSFKNAELAAQRTLAIPIYPELSDDNIEYVSEKIINFFNKN